MKSIRLDHHWEYVAGAVLCLLWLALAFHGASRKSLALDEPAHIGDGLAILRYHDYRMNPEHPPLFKILCAIPVELFDPSPLQVEREGQELEPWADGVQYMWGYYTIFLDRDDPQRMLLYARTIPIFFGLMGGIIAWLWAEQFGGRRAGLLAMVFLLYYPEYLGHARFVTFDVPTTVCCGAITLVAWHAWKKPSYQRLAALSLAAGIGGIIKLPVAVFAVFTLLTMLALLLARHIRKHSTDFPSSLSLTLRRWLILTAMMATAGYICQWAAVGFRFDLNTDMLPPAGEQRFLDQEQYPDSLLADAMIFARAHKLLPETSIAMIAHTWTVRGRIAFLMDDISLNGWYRYFLYTFALKTPLIYLLGTIAAAMYVFWRLFRGHGVERERLSILLFPFLLLLGTVVVSRLNIGHRHILFVYMPLAILIGVALNVLISRFRFGQYITGASAGIAIAVCLSVHPHQATYFNTLAGGNAYGGQRYLSDSNIDWGQDLMFGIETLNELGYTRANLAYFGTGRPQAHGLTEFNFLLPRYPMALMMPEAQPPDPNLPSLVSLCTLRDVRSLYPEHYEREPIAICNSMVIFAPKAEED